MLAWTAYPDGHPESEADEDKEIDYLKQKIDAGAEYIITQLFYDVDGFLRWERKVREKGMFIECFVISQLLTSL